MTQAVLQGMQLAKFKILVAVVLMAGLTCASAGMLGQPATAGKPSNVPPSARIADDRAVPRENDRDSDGDGLSDFQEVHKYRTDPHKKDSAGKGTADGDWDERRQYTYSIRTVLRVMPPYNKEALNDDYQDVRVLAEKKDFIDLEVISYPFNTNAEAIRGNPNWRKDYAGMKEYLSPGITTNWDAPMQKDLLAELRKRGIEPDRLTDKELVEQVSRWLFSCSEYRYMFCTYYMQFPNGRPAIMPGLEAAFEREKGSPDWTPRQQFEHELLGKEMYYRKSYGTCTSAAVYLATVLRALGIPTRMVLAVPVVDPCDDAQLSIVQKNIKHHQVRSTIYNALLANDGGFTSHTFNEVYVGHRWRRLNYTKLGQNILDRNCLGLLVHVHTFRDLSEAGLAATWGRRYALGQRDENFKYSNPYRALEISDLFGRYCKLANSPASDREHKQITLTKAYWFGSDQTPAPIRESWQSRVQDGSGHLFVHGEEWYPELDHIQYKTFMKRADRKFIFRAPGHPDVVGTMVMAFYTHPSAGHREIEIVIPGEQYAKMVKGIAYSIHAANKEPTLQWVVREGLTIKRE